MPELIDHVAYLSQEIGPRPAGTEEEQQAALYITEQIQKEAGLAAVIEDFDSISDGSIARIICYLCSLIAAVAAVFVPLLGLTAVVLTLIAALLFAAESFDRPLLSKMLKHGVSQNVVAKYEPSYSPETASRRRKVVLVSRYDSGKVRADLKNPFLRILPLFQRATLVAMGLVPILLLFRCVVFFNAAKGVKTVFNVLIFIALFFVAVSLVISLMNKWAPYNEGANCNAAGNAVLLEVARRVGHGRVSEAELAKRSDAIIHGEKAARAAGLIPEGAEILYEAQKLTPPEIAPQGPEERLLAAKAAIAALTGKPVSGVKASDISHNLVQANERFSPRSPDEVALAAAEGVPEALRGETAETGAGIPSDVMWQARSFAGGDKAALLDEAIQGTGEAPQGVFEQTHPGKVPSVAPEAAPAAAPEAALEKVPEQARETALENVPDWFRKAQEKARKPLVAGKPTQRSRYAAVLDAAESSDRFTQEIAAAQTVLKTAGTKPPQSLGEKPSDGFLSSDLGAGSAAKASLPPDLEYPEQKPEEYSFDDKAAVPAFSGSQQARENPPAQQDERPVDNSASAASDKPADTAFDKGDAGQKGQARQTPAAKKPSAHHPISLPDIGVFAAKPAPIMDLPKQRAPLADVENAGKVAAKSLLNMLPSIDIEEGKDASLTEGAAAIMPDASQDEKTQPHIALPSLSGPVLQTAGSEKKRSNINVAGAFVPASATGAFAPVGEELLKNVDPDDIYIDDVDDSVYETNITQTGAFAGPGYVEMPKSRMQRLLGRFRRKKEAEEPSAQEWLDVKETFDARTVGAERGGWESFREDEPFDMQDGEQDDVQDSRTKGSKRLGGKKRNRGDDQPWDSEADFGYEDAFDSGDFSSDKRRPWNGGAFSSYRARAGADADADADGEGSYRAGAEDTYRTGADADEESLYRAGTEDTGFDLNESTRKAAFPTPSDEEISDELRQIYQFRNPDINTEVWFVFLGSELAQNSGMRVFLTEHQQDLRGAIIIELDALGAGNMSVIEQEGMYTPVKTSSRMKRYVKKASQATGIAVQDGRLLWGNSSTAFALKHGYQAMHLAGMAQGKPAFFAQRDDVVENIEEGKLTRHADFIMELLKNI